MFISIKIFFLVFVYLILPLHSVTDLTIIGFIDPDDGIGKHSITILETLGDRVNSNFINTYPQKNINQNDPVHVIKAFNNPDKSPGKIALLTDFLGDINITPLAFIPKGCIIKLAYSVFETTQIPRKWVKILNEQFDGVIVPDKFLSQVYHHSGVKIPIFVLPLPMMLISYYSRDVHPIESSTPFVFGDASANKNPAVLIKAFAKVFGNNSKVHLKMRAPSFYHETRETIHRLIIKLGLTNVTFEEGKMDLEQFIDCLSSYDCYVNLSRGEGFSFIPREALALGIPVIISNNTASTTICDSGCVRSVPSLKKVPPLPVYKRIFGKEKLGSQFECEVDDVVEALRDVYYNYEEYVLKAREGRRWVEQYHCENPELQSQYLTLIKPKEIVLGNENTIQDGTIITNSQNLYLKYKKIRDSK